MSKNKTSRYLVTCGGVAKTVLARDVDGALDAYAQAHGYPDFDEWSRLSAPCCTVEYRGTVK